MLSKYVPEKPVPNGGPGLGCKLLNRRITVRWNQEHQSWGVRIRGLVSRKERNIHRLAFSLSDEAMFSLMAMVRKITADQSIYKNTKIGGEL